MSICLLSIFFRFFSVHSCRTSRQLQSGLKKNYLSDVSDPFFSHPLPGIGIQSRFSFSYTLDCCYSLIHSVVFILENQDDEMHHALEV